MKKKTARAPLGRVAWACVLGCGAALPAAWAGQGEAEPARKPAVTESSPLASAGPVPLERVELSGRHYDNGLGSADAASQGAIRAELLKSRPALRPGEVLEFVPGLIVTQHSGDGKANQYFLRGFNLDHGTDFATTVMGLPVNMPTHAHGQGYADLNFLIPELVERIDYRKGPYFARNGDFAAAGSADIQYQRRLDAPFASLTLGEGRYRRALAAGSTEVGAGMQLLGAVEAMGNDGPWQLPEALNRRNLVLSLSGGTGEDRWRVGLMDYRADWTSTDQVPQRLIDAGRFEGRPFGRFDAIDPTDGGRTRRGSLSGEWSRDAEGASTRVAAYAMSYQLSLYSNFTYAMERPDTGDQFAQQDDRKVYGVSASHAVDHTLGGLPARSELGVQLRQDRARVGLFDTEARAVIGTTRDDRVRETLVGIHGQTSVELTPWARTVIGVRADQARFRVDSLGKVENSGSARATLVSPKFSLVLGPWAKTEFFVDAGRGFHSNDARGVTARVDPRSGDPVDPVPGLVKARGMELGLRTEWLPGLQSSLALWKLDFDSELVYVGDAGATEANRPSRRRGIEWNNRYVPLPWLLIDADLAWTHARFSDADPAGDRIPNAVDRVASVGVTVRELGPWSASLQWRYLGSAALIEDDSVRSRPSLTTNLRVSRRFGAKTALTLDVFNLLDRKVNDIEYFYESRLPGEAAPVADRHVHPAEPRTVRVTLRRSF
ncbi:MAG: TonB-dependent receptor [Mitsuaria chitosanitabida]|uniref:TonB-dependent receptor n=1 Tax=Roseateles chitosanitabidus TaxID=65048 RepID=UPI001B2C4A1C|nr:TonB-dependent receptor [Roseateles chitosanitabidus]MBO9686316.1 TonB-dependent receptor [Roseateles chitosanitabidus]